MMQKGTEKKCGGIVSKLSTCACEGVTQVTQPEGVLES